MRIGEIAAQAEVNAQTVRLYERRGLLKKPRRLPSGYRDYAADVVLMIRFIKYSQALGFTLKEIKALIGLRSTGNDAADHVRELARAKLEEIDRKIGRLQEMRDTIEHGLRICQCRNPYPVCLLEKGEKK
jgi:DNA-binding transcriptional MerR regulator